VQGDPVNFYDPTGMNVADPDGVLCSNGPAEMWGGARCGGGGGGGGLSAMSIYFYWDGEGYTPVVSVSGGAPPSAPDPGGDKNPWYQQHPCDTGDSTNAEIIGFMTKYQADANAVAADTGLNATFVLAWASYESAWGASNVATQDNNFFGLTPDLNSTPQVHWAGSDPYSGCAVQGYDCFASQPAGLTASATSALSSFGAKYLYAALAAETAGGSARDIAQAIVDKGFNSVLGPGVYAGIVQSRVGLIDARKDCPK
jgi:hypothetical protein